MVDITSVYAANLGALILNLTSKGLIVRIGQEETMLQGSVLFLQVTDFKNKKVLKEVLAESVVTAIADIDVIADAIRERIRKS